MEDRNINMQPWQFGLDAIGRQRVSNPESLIDADFEYGLQNTKWQNVSTINNIPSFYEDVGADLVFNTNGYATLINSVNTLTSNADTSINVANSGTPPFITNDYALLTSQTQGNVIFQVLDSGDPHPCRWNNFIQGYCRPYGSKYFLDFNIIVSKGTNDLGLVGLQLMLVQYDLFSCMLGQKV